MMAKVGADESGSLLEAMSAMGMDEGMMSLERGGDVGEAGVILGGAQLAAPPPPPAPSPKHNHRTYGTSASSSSTVTSRCCFLF